jgi:hypothetical protein
MPFGRAGRRFDGGGLDKLAFRQPPRVSSLTSRGNQTMFYLGPAIVVKISLILADSRPPPGSIYRHKEHKPFAVQ